MPVRGDVHRLAAPRRARGREQKGKRYGVVLQADELTSLSTVIVAPTSRSAGASLLRPVVAIEGAATQVMVEQVRAVDQQRLGRRVGHLSWEELEGVDRALRLVLGL